MIGTGDAHWSTTGFLSLELNKLKGRYRIIKLEDSGEVKFAGVS